jgi:hypothetical protein
MHLVLASFSKTPLAGTNELDQTNQPANQPIRFLSHEAMTSSAPKKESSTQSCGVAHDSLRHSETLVFVPSP